MKQEKPKNEYFCTICHEKLARGYCCKKEMCVSNYKTIRKRIANQKYRVNVRNNPLVKRSEMSKRRAETIEEICKQRGITVEQYLDERAAKANETREVKSEPEPPKPVHSPDFWQNITALNARLMGPTNWQSRE